MALILHITPRQHWELAQANQVYRCESLNTEGFIHCSTPQQVVKVANLFFAGQSGLVLLEIACDRLESELRYEEVNGEFFPHLYGPLNLEAVVRVLEFTPNAAGKFQLPVELEA